MNLGASYAAPNAWLRRSEPLVRVGGSPALDIPTPRWCCVSPVGGAGGNPWSGWGNLGVSTCALTVRNGREIGFLIDHQPDQEPTTAYRDCSGPNSRSDAHCATIVGDWEKPSGETPDSNKEKQIWVIKEKKTKAGENNKKWPSSI